MTVTVVTGCSTGIGFATAMRLAQDGHTVHASVRSEASGAALVEAAADLDLRLLLMDVDDDHSVESAFSELGPVDVLVNNAGITKGHCVEETSMADYLAAMNTNCWGTLRCIKAVLPSMRERRSGRIVNVTSAAERVVNPSQTAYCMSKSAAGALTEGLACEVAPFGIKVSAVEPGVIVTPIFDKAFQDLAPADSPYKVANDRVGGWFLQSLLHSKGLPPEAVADVIADVVAADEPALRYLVGHDAEALVAERESIGGDEWLRRNGDVTDDEWWAWSTAVTGVPAPDPAG